MILDQPLGEFDDDGMLVALMHRDRQQSRLTFSGPRLVYNSNGQTDHTGTTTVTAIKTVTIPGGLLGANGVLRIGANFNASPTANSKVINIKLNGTVLATFSLATYGNRRVDLEVFWLASTTALRFPTGFAAIGPEPDGQNIGTAVVDNTQSMTLTVECTLGQAAEVVQLLRLTVEALRSD